MNKYVNVKQCRNNLEIYIHIYNFFEKQTDTIN